MKVMYLAGPIANQTDAQCNDWRNQVIAELGSSWEFNNPMKRDFRGVKGDHSQEIVEGDKNDIQMSDLLFAYCPFPTVGTSMEILYAWESGVEVVVVCPNDSPSPWYVYHSILVCKNLENAIAFAKGYGEAFLREQEVEDEYL